MLTKKNIIVLILILTGFTCISSDDGSWSKSFTIEGGSIYSESDNTDIELIKEILIFTGEYTKAVFQFKNTSDKAVTISCGFPVRYEINTHIGENGLVIPVSSYGPDDDIPVLDYFETLPLKYTDPDDYTYGMTTNIILINNFNNSREFISPQELPEDLTFNIKQNGKTVEINKILLERYANRDGAGVTFHYRHDLNFKQGEISTVVVEYHQDLFQGGDGMSDYYLWNYVIGTGGTWKGPIGELILIKPSDWRGSIDEMDILLENNYITILRAADYEPARDTAFSLRHFSSDMIIQYDYFDNTLPELKKMWTGNSKLAIQSSDAVQNFVTDITASSFLPDKLSVFTNNGVILKANFSPAAAFDGLTETSWCENVSGDGIGEYIEFSLTKDIWGLSISNGFTRLPVNDWMFGLNREGIPFEEKIRDDSNGIKDYFTQNNRIKKLSITDLSGNILYIIDLEDIRDPQTFTGIRLSSGTFRLVIEEVYQGMKWKDTCLGEITFLVTGSSQQINRFTEDMFYMDALKGVSYK